MKYTVIAGHQETNSKYLGGLQKFAQTLEKVFFELSPPTKRERIH